METITDWLKHTIYGIIVLGAVGSILAIYVMRFCGVIFKRYIPTLYKFFKKLGYAAGFRHGFFWGFVIGEDDVLAAIVYVGFYIARMIMGVLFLVACLFMLYVMLMKQDVIRLSLPIYAASFGCSVITYMVYRDFEALRTIFMHVVVPVLKKADKSRKEKEQPNQSPEPTPTAVTPAAAHPSRQP